MRSWCYRTRLAAGRVCWCFTSRPHARGASEHMSGISMHAHVRRLVLICVGRIGAFASRKRSPPPPPPPPPNHILTFRMNSSCVNSSSTSSSGSCFAIVLHRGVHPVGKIRLEMLLEMLLGNTCHHSPTIPTLLFVMTSSTRTRRPLVFVAFVAQV